ncbi:MAG: response regulator transcription factor [Armatimonadota bacterium]
MAVQNSTPIHPIRILIVDDHPAIRKGLAFLLSPEGIIVCAEASGRLDALGLVDDHQPDLAIVDLSLGGEDGLELVEELRKHAVPSLVYSMHKDARHVESAFSAGALGYVTKGEADRVLVEGIRETAAGRRFVSPIAAVALADLIARPTEHDIDSELSDKERQVYHLLGQGEGTIEIAAAMHISTHTVVSYYTRILNKLDLDGMRDLRRHAINHLHDYTS